MNRPPGTKISDKVFHDYMYTKFGSYIVYLLASIFYQSYMGEKLDKQEDNSDLNEEWFTKMFEFTRNEKKKKSAKERQNADSEDEDDDVEMEMEMAAADDDDED